MRGRTIVYESFFAALLFACFVSTTVSQTPGCIEFRNVEFFVPANIGKVHWSEGDLQGLIGDATGKDKTNWLVPVIVKQLKDYKPSCGTMEVDQRLDLLIKLYSIVRRNERLVSSEVSIKEKLESIREDFYRQLEDDELLPMLILTFDDGPLFGEIAVNEHKIKLVSSRGYPTAFGQLIVSNSATRAMITAIDKRNRIMWSRYLKGASLNRYLMKADLEDVSVKQGEFATLLQVFVDGEKIIMYLRPNGRFLYYTHSW